MADMIHDEEEKEGKDDEEEEEEVHEMNSTSAAEVEEYVVREEELQELKADEENEDEDEDEDEDDDDDDEEEEEEEERIQKPMDKDVCRHCHQPGHKERKCPILHPELVKAPRMKPKKNTTELEIRQRVRPISV